MDVQKDLEYYFGDYLNENKTCDWNQSKSLVNSGQTISGKVIYCYRFGVFVDCGLGFPALLPVTHFEHARERIYGVKSLSDYPQVGNEIRARLVSCSDKMRQFGLTQWKHHPDLDL